MKIDRALLPTIREYLDEIMYGLVDYRLSFHLEMSSLGFPTLQSLRTAVRQLGPTHGVLFRLFRIGEAVDDASLRRALPGGVIETLIALELLIRDDAGAWRTPSLLILPAEGLYLVVGIPPIYSTATRQCHTGFDASSSIVAKTLPTSLSGRRVLDICSGSGIQGLLCAKRGAASVVCLELNEEAVITSRANAILNGLEERMDCRQSEKLAALGESERFDFVVCNSPSAPMIRETGAPSSPEEIGNVVLRDLLGGLPAHLHPESSGVLCAWRSLGYQSRTYQARAIAAQLARAGFSTAAYVELAPNTIESILRGVQTEMERRPGMQRSDAAALMKGVREQSQQPEKPIDGAYNQLIFFKRGEGEASAEPEIFPLFAPAAHAKG